MVETSSIEQIPSEQYLTAEELESLVLEESRAAEQEEAKLKAAIVARAFDGEGTVSICKSLGVTKERLKAWLKEDLAFKKKLFTNYNKNKERAHKEEELSEKERFLEKYKELRDDNAVCKELVISPHTVRMWRNTDIEFNRQCNIYKQRSIHKLKACIYELATNGTPTITKIDGKVQKEVRTYDPAMLKLALSVIEKHGDYLADEDLRKIEVVFSNAVARSEETKEKSNT